MKYIQRIITGILVSIGIFTMSSCSDTETYSFKEACGYEVFDISSIQASQSVYQSYAWIISEETYSYLDCRYVKVNLDINAEYLSSWPPSTLKDDAYCLRADAGNFGNNCFYISHNTNYMYFDGLKGTYRSKDKMPAEFITSIGMKNTNQNNTLSRTINIDYGHHLENQALTLLGEALIPSKIVEKYDLPVVAGDNVMIVYSGEWEEQETYPSIINDASLDVIAVYVNHLPLVELEVLENQAGKTSLYPTGEDPHFKKYLTTNCINPDHTFNDIGDYPIGTKIYAVDKDGEALAFYSYNPYEN